jgi:rubrerythrin
MLGAFSFRSRDTVPGDLLPLSWPVMCQRTPVRQTKHGKDHDMDKEITDIDGQKAEQEPLDLPGLEDADSPVEDEPVCAICGHRIEPDDIECPNCGTSLVAG